MRKIKLYAAILCCLLGVALLALAGMLELKGDALLWGMGGGLIGAGGSIIWRYLYWMRPKNREKYTEMLNAQRIELHDERKIMLRDKSGRIVYQITIYLYCFLMVAGAVCASFGIFMPFARYAVIGLTLLLVFQYICGIVVFQYLNERM